MYCSDGQFFRNHYSNDGPSIHLLVSDLARQFIEIGDVDRALLDNHGDSYKERARARDAAEGSLQNLYQELDIGDGEPVYLSDGVWLNSDGSMDDRGR